MFELLAQDLNGPVIGMLMPPNRDFYLLHKLSCKRRPFLILRKPLCVLVRFYRASVERHIVPPFSKPPQGRRLGAISRQLRR